MADMQTADIVMSYDDSLDSRRALTWAAAEAIETTRPLRVLMIEDVQAKSTAPRAAGAVPSPVPHALENARLQIADQHVPAVTFEHRVGRVVSILLNESDSASCLVLGSHGHGPFGEAVLGSVSHYVARHATCPVVVVREPLVKSSKRIVVGMDGSPQSAAALEYACARAERTLDKVLAIHVSHQHDLHALGGRYDPPANLDLDPVPRGAVDSFALARATHPGVDLELKRRAGSPAQILVDSSRNASLLVVGSRGHGYVNGLLLGSVSQGVLHRAECAIAVIR